MASKTNPALIGAFALGAVGLTIAAVVLWGSRSLFERKYEYVCYFDGAVQGLSQGAPVKYRGVDVGVVKDIRVRYRETSGDSRIPVMIELWGKRLRELGGDRDPTPALVRELVGRGLRARLSSLSIVTGVAYVSFEELPGSPINYSEVPGPHGLPEIPTVPRELEEATHALMEVLANLKGVDFKRMSSSIADAAQGINDVVRGPALRTALERLPGVMAAAHRLIASLHTDAEKVGVVADDVHGATAALTRTIDGARDIVSPNAPLSVDVAATLSDVDKAAIAVRELADFLRRNPHAIIAGTKPRGATR
jgi:paraquat-inducible protein B